MQSLKFQFGTSQTRTSGLMRKWPMAGRLVFAIFGYTSVGNYARSRVFKKLITKLPLQRFSKIMDLGAGLGEYTFTLAKSLPDAHFTAVEILPARVAALNHVVRTEKLSNVEVFDRKIEFLDQPGHYDFIFSVDVFEHILEAEMPFDQCFQKLAPSGYLLVKMPNIHNRTILPQSCFGEHNEWLDKEHIGQVYDLEALKARFTKAGFNIVHASYDDGLLSRAAWELAYFSKKLGSIFQLLMLPLCKFLVILDGIVPSRKQGNTIQVIGQKPSDM